VIAAAHAYEVYVVLLMGCALAVSVTALRLGRALSPAQDAPTRTRVVTAHPVPEPVTAPA
jgi:hypothetical protein